MFVINVYGVGMCACSCLCICLCGMYAHFVLHVWGRDRDTVECVWVCVFSAR